MPQSASVRRTDSRNGHHAHGVGADTGETPEDRGRLPVLRRNWQTSANDVGAALEKKGILKLTNEANGPRCSGR
jgi:hypothetical protein